MVWFNNEQRKKFLNTLFGGFFFVIAGIYTFQILNTGGEVFQSHFGDIHIDYRLILQILYFVLMCSLIFIALLWSRFSDITFTKWAFLAYFVGWSCICSFPVIVWRVSRTLFTGKCEYRWIFLII
nr:hypothetical protein [Nanoarchaeota archaeon]